MALRGNSDFPFDPAQTTGTELSTLLNSMVAALDSTNGTDDQTPPGYAVRGTQWVDANVGGNVMTMSIFTGSAWASLFEIDITTGQVTRPAQQTIQLQDGANGGSLRQEGLNTELWADDGAGGETREFYVNSFGTFVNGKLGIGYDAGLTTPFAMSISPNVSNGVQVKVNNVSGTAVNSVRFEPGKLTGGVSAGSGIGNNLTIAPYGLTSVFYCVDGMNSSANTGYYIGVPGNTAEYAGLGQVGVTGTGPNVVRLSMFRNAASTVNFIQLSNTGDTGTPVMYVSPTGQVHGTGPYVDLSDAQSKDAIEEFNPASQAGDIILNLSPKTFVRKGQTEPELGFVANEVEQHLPQAVKEWQCQRREEIDRAYEEHCRYAESVGIDPATVPKPVYPDRVTAPMKGLALTPLIAMLWKHSQTLEQRLRELEARL